MASIKLPSPDRNILKRRDKIVEGLISVVGADCVIADEDGRRAYEADAFTAYTQLPLAVVLANTTQDVSKLLRYCHTQRLKVFPRGAGTSLCGGALPAEDGIVICISKMNKILAIDIANRFVRVEAGVANLAISEAVKRQGYFYAPDPSSQLACTIAGNIAMNSGGAHCLKYGVTLNNVLGVKIVTIEGEIVEIGGPYLDASGVDLLGLIVGSEGQFGIITEATVRILHTPEGARPMMVGFNSSADAGACVAAIVGAGIVPVALEYMDKLAIRVCEDFVKAGYPTDVEALLIVEVEGSPNEISILLNEIEKICRRFNPHSVVVSKNDDQTARIWRGLKSAFSAIGRIADFYCMDGTIPLGKLPEVLAGISDIVARYGLRVANVFHAGDGNLHPLILFDANDPKQLLDAERAGAEILQLCVEVGGCLSGEHGVGIEKRDLMPVQFSKDDIDLQMRIKTSLDPHWLLNPGKVFPLQSNDNRETAA